MLTKQDWLLLLLEEQPLDRIRLMKALFLIWHRSGRKISGFYDFIPYMYGPCSFDLYRELTKAEHNQLVAQAPHPVSHWAPYFITEKGRHVVASVIKNAEDAVLKRVAFIAKEVATTNFNDLLRRVYEEAPDFASQSVVKRRPCP